MEKVNFVEIPHKNELWNKPIHAGHMTKEGSSTKNWKRRFMILTLDGKLWYFKTEKAKKPQRKDPVYLTLKKFWVTMKEKNKPNCVKVERFPAPFFFHADTPEEQSVWLEKLSLAGGIFCNTEYKGERFVSNPPDVTKKDLKKWTPEIIKQFLFLFSFSDSTPFSVYANEFWSTSGKQFEKMTKEGLLTLGIKKKLHNTEMMEAIEELKRERIVSNYEELIVLKKLESAVEKCGKVEGNLNLRILARYLSDPDLLQETYLNPYCEEQVPRINLGKQSKFAPSENEASSFEKNFNENVKLCRLEAGIFDVSASKLILPVKVFLTELKFIENFFNVANKTSPTTPLLAVPSKGVSRENRLAKFHPVVVVGPFYLEFTESSVCIPRRVTGAMSMLLNDFKSVGTTMQMTFREVTSKLSAVICKWNCRMTSKSSFMSSQKKVNEVGTSMGFVDDILQSFGLRFGKDGCYGEYLKKLRSQVGEEEMTFIPSPRFINKFGLDPERKEYKFQTHSELDKFVSGVCIKVDEKAFSGEYNCAKQFLKCYDRAFWIRYFRNPKDEKSRPSDECPFMLEYETYFGGRVSNNKEINDHEVQNEEEEKLRKIKEVDEILNIKEEEEEE